MALRLAGMLQSSTDFAFDRIQQGLPVERFGKGPAVTDFACHPQIGLGAVPSSRHGNEIHLRVVLYQRLERLEAIFLRHDETDQNQVERLLRHHFQRLLAIRGGFHLIPLDREYFLKDEPEGGIVVNDQDLCFGVTIQDEKQTGFPAKAALMDSSRFSPCLRTVEM
jgi:hypothetical protein